ncbi:MAG: CapA family protein [Butyrivibrio sp.]|nr:CapA family protein [Butyrivibrio sp.]
MSITSDYECILKDKAVQVHDKRGQTIWNSDKDIKVQDVMCLDLDMDNQNEMVLLCWKKGKYGKALPFWEKDNNDWTQHIYIYNIRNNEAHAIWMASDIGLVVSQWKTLNVGDIQAILIRDTSGKDTLWRWDSWGLKQTDSSVNFLCVGDNLIQEAIYETGLTDGKGFDYLYKDFTGEIKKADYAVINQETIFVDDPKLYSGYPYFGTPLEVGEAILNAGFNVITCATNHALDKGTYGINITADFYESEDITYLGIQQENEKYEPYKVLEKNGMKIGCFNYTYGVNVDKGNVPENIVHIVPEDEKLKEEVESARSFCDAIVVFIHWGKEYSTVPDDSQKKLAQYLCDLGVDVVVGTHPHVIQPMEVLQSKSGHETLVYYSLGNFISGQNIAETNIGGMATFTFSYTIEGVAITDYSLIRHELKY